MASVEEEPKRRRKFDLAELEVPLEEEIQHLDWKTENCGGSKKKVAKHETQEEKKSSPDHRREQTTAEQQPAVRGANYG